MTEPTLNAMPDDFDLDGWIDGTCNLTRIAKIYQRGDLFAKMDELEAELDIVGKIPKEDRGVDARGPEAIQEALDALTEEIARTAITVHVQDRTNDRRRKITDRLVKQGLKLAAPADNETISLHLLADAIVKVESFDGKVKAFPDGFPVEKLRRMKDQLGDAALIDTWNAFHKVTGEAPAVAAPLSQGSSSNRGGIT